MTWKAIIASFYHQPQTPLLFTKHFTKTLRNPHQQNVIGFLPTAKAGVFVVLIQQKTNGVFSVSCLCVSCLASATYLHLRPSNIFIQLHLSKGGSGRRGSGRGVRGVGKRGSGRGVRGVGKRGSGRGVRGVGKRGSGRGVRVPPPYLQGQIGSMPNIHYIVIYYTDSTSK
jgi:hypothetical protein